MEVLNIEVEGDLLDRWCGWLAPSRQPFFVGSTAGAPDGASLDDRLSDELGDTYRVWRMPDRGVAVWLDEHSFLRLPRPHRAALVREQVTRRRAAVPTVKRWASRFDPERLRQQADGHRFVWWPSLLRSDPLPVLADLIAEAGPPSRHRDVPNATWRRCRGLVPHAADLAGTFARSSGPNCFSAVMEAAGDRAPSRWVTTGPFEVWLRDRCVEGGDDGEVGTVLVWRDRDRRATHAAVTLGDGWAMEKPSQTWWTPRTVLEVPALIGVNRTTGRRLTRYRISR